MKKRIIHLILPFLIPSFVYSQHLKFMDVELGANREVFKYKLMQKGFIPGKGDKADYLYGMYFARESMIVCPDNNGNVNKVIVWYGDKHDYSYSEALDIKRGIEEFLIESLSKEQRFYLFKDVHTLGSCVGDVFHLKDGYIEVYEDGHSLNVVYNDCPENSIFLYHENNR